MLAGSCAHVDPAGKGCCATARPAEGGSSAPDPDVTGDGGRPLYPAVRMQPGFVWACLILTLHTPSTPAVAMFGQKHEGLVMNIASLTAFDTPRVRRVDARPAWSAPSESTVSVDLNGKPRKYAPLSCGTWGPVARGGTGWSSLEVPCPC